MSEITGKLCGLTILFAGLPLDANGEDKEIAKLPWHLASARWTIKPVSGFENASMDVSLNDDLSVEQGYFIVPFNSYLNNTLFYFGACTDSFGTDQNGILRTNLGKAFVFTKWDELEADAMLRAHGGHYLLGTHEGRHVTVRANFPWKKGKYRFELARLRTEIVKGARETWVGAFVYSYSTKEQVFVGALRFKGDPLRLSFYNSTFMELYDAKQKSNPSSLKEFKALVGNYCVNDEPASVLRVNAEYDRGVPGHGAVELLSKNGCAIHHSEYCLNPFALDFHISAKAGNRPPGAFPLYTQSADAPVSRKEQVADQTKR